MRYQKTFTIIAFFISAATFGQNQFIGEIKMFGGNFAPRGWALCNGQLLPVSSYDALFSLLGTTYGGDGRTTFGLPDLRGRSAVHPGNGPGLPSVRLGEKGGSTDFTLTTNNLPPHSHSGHINVSDTEGDIFYTNNSYIADSSRVVSQQFTNTPPTGSKRIQGLHINNTGGGQSVSKRSPFQAVTYIIALEGTYPSRN